jgi:cytochrome c biogenesis protein CcdA
MAAGVTMVGTAATGPDATVAGYAFALGLVAVANPCGLPLLPAYRSFFVGGGGDVVGRALRADTSGQLAGTSQVTDLPTTLFLDGTGKAVVRHPGTLTAENLVYALGQFFPVDVPQGGS